MSSENRFMSKEFWKSAGGQRLFCVLGLLASVLFLLFQFGGDLGSILPGSGSRDVLTREIKKSEQDIARLKDSLAQIDAVRAVAESKLVGAWKQSVNGVPEVELRSLIEKAAKTLGLRLNNISTVRKTNFNSDMSILELDISVTTDIDTLTKFLLAVDQLEPKLYWRRFECRTSNMFGMAGVQFNGSLRCTNDERQEAVQSKSQKQAQKTPAAAEKKGAGK